MDQTEEAQALEITALQSIYPDEFIQVPPPKAWRGASRLREFIIRISHPDPDHASKINFNLHVKFPKTYPRLACPIFIIEKPIKGINDTQAAKLLQSINAEAQKLKGFEMVFNIITLCQDWIEQYVTPPVEVVGSLALQMKQRAMEEQMARYQKEMEVAHEEEERANRAARELGAQIEADMLAKELQYKARKRANSGATEVPPSSASGYGDVDTLTESFNEMDLGNGVRFNTVKLFHPRTAHLGLVYMADPIVDDMKGPTIPLELYVVSFQSHYYTTTQGRKKLTQVETEIKALISVRHPKLLSIYAVKLNFPHSSGLPQLMVLMEQAPALTM